jgi:hypothetical protein
MIYTGYVRNRVVILDEEASLPDGTQVRVEPVEVQKPKTLAEKFQDVIGKAKDMPADFAEQHDHYIHGAPKE